MPCLELHLAAQPHPEPATRLRALLEKPGAPILRRNHIVELPDAPAPLRDRIRVAAVLAVDLSDPPYEAAPPAAENIEDGDLLEAGPPVPEPHPADSHDPSAGFVKGLEIWFSDGAQTACVFADLDEIPPALTLFDSWLRLAHFQPAFQRLDQRMVGLHLAFREGLTLAIQGSPAEPSASPDAFFACIGAIPEIDDFRQPRFAIRLPGDALIPFYGLLRTASAWLDENSYPNILGSR